MSALIGKWVRVTDNRQGFGGGIGGIVEVRPLGVTVVVGDRSVDLQHGWYEIVRYDRETGEWIKARS